MMNEYNRKGEAFLSAKEKIAEASQALEDFCPEIAEELTWYAEQLVSLLTELQTEQNFLADGGDLWEGAGI